MFTSINWNEKNVDDIYEYYSGLNGDESLQFLNYILEHYPELNIEWIDMFEEIKIVLFEEGRIDDILDFLNSYQRVFPNRYETEYEFIERDLISHLLFKGDIENLKERLEIIKRNPVHGVDTVTVRVLFELLYHGHYELALEYSRAVWHTFLDSKLTNSKAYTDFCNTIYLDELEKFYQDIKNGSSLNGTDLLERMAVYEFYEEDFDYDGIYGILKEPFDIQDMQSKILLHNGKRDPEIDKILGDELLATIQIHFLKYMKEEFGIPFTLSDCFLGILSKIELFGKVDPLEGFFYIPYPTLSEHANRMYDRMFLTNETENFGKVFGLKYFYNFLHIHHLIDDHYYGLMEENIRMLENDFKLEIRESLWQMKFVFDWPQLPGSFFLGREMFLDTYHFHADPRIPEMLDEYLTNYTIPERIQNEIDEFEAKKNEEGSRYYKNQSSFQPIINAEPKVGRNDSCPCGSGKKFKKCCMK